MKWRKRLIEKCRKFLEDAAKDNEKAWKGQKPSCCGKRD